MADPLQVIRSLDTLSDHYAVFEPDQVLTHGQLNSVSDYLDDQLRLGRVLLDGVGLIAGLHVSLQGDGSVRISAGFGVSTDGDLMRLGADTVYDRLRPYDATAAVYAPLHAGSAMLDLQELVPVGESDVLAQPLATLAGGASDKAVLMLMETVVNDPDLCSGTGCDNLGRDALHRLRFLLISRADAQALLDARTLLPASTRAQNLPALAMRRPALTLDIASVGALAARYRDTANLSLLDLLQALPELAQQCPEVLSDMFGGDPTGRWKAALEAQRGRLAGSTASGECQVWYSFIKDLVTQWSELREALLNDDGVMLPDVAAFPKHLLLGALANPRSQRTGLYPSPLDASARQSAAHSRFLAWKFDALIRSFALPTDVATVVTPSHSDARRLEERAIPWYFAVGGGANNGTNSGANSGNGEDQPIHVAWNFRLSASRREGQNLGYRSAKWGSSAQAKDPLAFAIGSFDFFRVEGHLGRQVESVGDELRKLIANRNLPIHVQEVLLHNDRKFIKQRPPIRYTPLHSLHYLVRQDVSLRLNESLNFGSRHLADMTTAVASAQVPAITDSGASVITVAGSAKTAIGNVQAAAQPVLSQTSHSGYKAQMAGTGAGWRSSYATGLETVGNTRASLGHVSRTDFVSPYDSLFNTNQPHWIDWLDNLIQAHDDRADDKLLFARFVQDHPGIDHLGGVWRGGTLVLVYDDGGRVVGDFTLPYPAAEVIAPEPVEPPLTLPIYRPPFVVNSGLRVLRPIDLKVSDRVLVERHGFQLDLEKQAANIQGLVQGVFVPNNAVVPKRIAVPGLAGLDGLKGDSYLEYSARDMAGKLDRVQELKDRLTQPALPDDTRVLFVRDLAAAQTDLASAVATVTERVVAGKIDVASDAGVELTAQLGRSVSMIQDAGARTLLDTRLTGISPGTGVGVGQSALIGKLRVIGGIGRG
ncbi:MAG: hypothetical protein ABIN96_01910 [Rubrivivax sp.]